MTSTAAACKWEGVILHRVIWNSSHEIKLINHSLLVYRVCMCMLCVWVLGWRDAWLHILQEVCLHISMSGGLLSSVWYWLVALGSLQVSISQMGTEEERDGGVQRGGTAELLEGTRWSYEKRKSGNTKGRWKDGKLIESRMIGIWGFNILGWNW